MVSVSKSLIEYIQYEPPIVTGANMYSVFDQFRKNPNARFIPVVSQQNEPVGVVREYDLKEYAYGLFGRELIKHRNLQEFILPGIIVSLNEEVDAILHRLSVNDNPDGIIVTRDGKYFGVILSSSIMQIYEKNRQTTRLRLLQSQKFEAIGTLAGGIAHDFNNILMPIIGYSELTKLRFRNTSPEIIDGFLDQIIQAGNRARDLASQILSFSRQQKQESVLISLGAIVSETLKLIRPAVPSTIDIRFTKEIDHDTIMADPTQIHQVLMNLFTNASYAMRISGGILDVKLTVADDKIPGHIIKEINPEYAPFIHMQISDTGNGIAPEIIDRICEPFFTTKKVGEGTGMGLSVVLGIIQSCKGSFSVESTCGKGSNFHVYFPLSKQKSSEQQKRNTRAVPLLPDGRRIRILLVDDEPMITSMVTEGLADFGIDVTSKNNSTEAFMDFQVRNGQYSAVVTDQTMPGLTGAELAKRILQIKPEFPVILCTGYSEIITAEMAKALGIRQYLIKPINLSDLAEAIIHEINTDVSDCLD
jgi:signal transduction histidine kinase/CheY-like chemotaxis protein